MIVPVAAPLERLDEIRKRGFTIAPGIVSADEVGDLKQSLEKAIAEDLNAWHGREYTDAHMVLNLMTRGMPFVRLLENDLLHAYLGPLLGDTCILYAYTSSSMPAGGTNYSRRVHVDCPRVIPNYITNVGVTIALDNFTNENGAMELLPGSFTREQPPSEDEFDEHSERAYPLAGDAIIFNARTWHRGGVNRTSAYRHAVTMNVCRSYMRQQFDYPRLVAPDVIGELGPLGRRFLGFNVRMPASLDEYYVPAEQRLYQPNQG
ncbi:MAG TPA: phytanoyl-CoA dioxygenase family protein [Candidatus Baltobacteraceae bacterium]|nr:phytanoyl-CoA dioxygenase family protein [Candidatus Baltobacteraceae bacterium]